MTKIKVIARIRPFLPHEKVDDVISVERGAVLVKDLRVPGHVKRYRFVLLLLLCEGTFSCQSFPFRIFERSVRSYFGRLYVPI